MANTQYKIPPKSKQWISAISTLSVTRFSTKKDSGKTIN